MGVWRCHCWYSRGMAMRREDADGRTRRVLVASSTVSHDQNLALHCDNDNIDCARNAMLCLGHPLRFGSSMNLVCLGAFKFTNQARIETLCRAPAPVNRRQSHRLRWPSERGKRILVAKHVWTLAKTISMAILMHLLPCACGDLDGALCGTG